MSKKPSALLKSIVTSAASIATASDADAVMILLEAEADWGFLKRRCSKTRLIVASLSQEIVNLATEHEIATVTLDNPEATIYDRLTQAVLESIANEDVVPGASVVAIYSAFDTEQIDTVSLIKLSERLGRLTARDLQRLETNVPLDTLKSVVDLAVEIGREGREGKAVGTLFVVGDHRKVVEHSRAGGFDFVKAYTRKERNIMDSRVREGIKEIALMDGAFIVAADGTIEASCRIIDTNPVEITMTTGLGSRHFAGAAISKNTKAVSVVVSESNGTVRIFQDGEVVLRIEPLRRALKWKDAMHPATSTPSADAE